jgi:hypothetical protein
MAPVGKHKSVQNRCLKGDQRVRDGQRFKRLSLDKKRKGKKKERQLRKAKSKQDRGRKEVRGGYIDRKMFGALIGLGQVQSLSKQVKQDENYVPEGIGK